MPADLPLVLNLDQPIPALRSVRSVTELLTQDLPPLAAGATLSGEVRLINGNGERWAPYLASNYTLRLLISVAGPTGPVQLALLGATDFTAIVESEVQTGWSFNLPLTTQAIKDFLAGWSDGRAVNFEISLITPVGWLKLLFLRSATLMPRTFEPAVPNSTMASPEQRQDITNATLHRVIPTVGHSLMWVILTWENGQWITWTLRPRTEDDPSDDDIANNVDGAGDDYRLPSDANAVSNNVIWAHTAQN